MMTMSDEELAGIEERTRLWRDQKDPSAFRLEDAEALLAEVSLLRMNMKHHVALIRDARERASEFRLRYDELGMKVDAAMRHAGAELGDHELRTN